MRIPAFIDVEASGFGAGSYPIEVGYVLGNGEAYCELVRPEPGWTHWDSTAEQMHHIQREHLHKRGRSVQDIADMLNQHLGGLDVYTDAWGHDAAWINRIFDSAQRLQGFRVRDLRELLTTELLSRWDTTKSQVIHQLGVQRHRASSDALILQTTFLTLTGKTRIASV